MSQRPPRRRLPRDWSGFLLFVLAFVSFILGVVGFGRYLPNTPEGWLDAAYRTIQLFFLEFNPPDGDRVNVSPWLQAARFGAFMATVWAILKTFVPQVRQRIRRWLRLRGKACAVILGYGPAGQAIGATLWQRNCGIRRVTAVHRAVTPELAARARLDGVLLIEGDPTDPRILDRAYAGKAERIYVSDPDDLRAIDTAVAVRQHIPDPTKDIRVVLNDSAVAAQIAEATDAGFLGAPNLRWFSVADETARLLIADARFDRFALESGAEQMHLVIIGCGSQGEAIAVEALLTAWRVGLGPPKITFFDRDPSAVEARMRRRMPAWFLQPDGRALYPAARPDLVFLPCDAETLDFARDPSLDNLRARVSGWVFATGYDGLNLRASLALHRAIAARQIDPAPIYVRIPTGHVEDTPELSGNPLTLAHTFGSIESVIDRSPLVMQDPDSGPKGLHAAYARTAVEMGLTIHVEDWATLPESKRDANRALFRHASMKIEDFGAVAEKGQDGIFVTHPNHLTRIAAVDRRLAYDRIDEGTDVQTWLKDGETFSDEQEEVARRIRDAAVCEHNRWTVERALAQFIPTESPGGDLRDDVRRLHNNMHDWYKLGDARTRRYDLVMLRALFSAGKDVGRTRHTSARTQAIFLSVDGVAGTCEKHVFAGEVPDGADASELHLHINAVTELEAPAKLVAAVVERLKPHVDPLGRVLPTRIRFDFARLPGAQTLALANMVAAELRKRLPETVRIDAFWNWRAAGGPVVGVVGHRDLTAFGGLASETERLRQTFMDLVIRRGVEKMVTGYAPGADRAAVAAWASLGLPKPVLVFPFEAQDAEGRRVYFTEEPSVATEQTTVAEKTARDFGQPVLSSFGKGHRAQADEVLERADINIFVVDENSHSLDGGSHETLVRARQMQREIIVNAPISETTKTPTGARNA